MKPPETDQRSRERRARDERVAAEPPLAPLDIPAGAKVAPVEALLALAHRPFAVSGIVENGLVRPLDPAVKLPEHSRVIIVAADR